MANLIDICIEFVESKNCFYLAKEGCIVYYDSITGRQSDYDWHRLSVSEAMRTVSAMRLSGDQASTFRQGDLIAAFQELGRVYEFGVKSKYKVKAGIFNYYDHCEASLSDMIISELLVALQKHSYHVVPKVQLSEIIQEVCVKLDCAIPMAEMNHVLVKHCEREGYEIRTGVSRILIKGRKTAAILKEGYKPSDAEIFSQAQKFLIINSIVKAVR